MLGTIGQADSFERGHRAGTTIAQAGVDHRQLDLLDGRRARQPVEPLEHEADPSTANLRGLRERVLDEPGVAVPFDPRFSALLTDLCCPRDALHRAAAAPAPDQAGERGQAVGALTGLRAYAVGEAVPAAAGGQSRARGRI